MRKREFYVIVRDNEAIKLHCQFLSINLNKNVINFNTATPLYPASIIQVYLKVHYFAQMTQTIWLSLDDACVLLHYSLYYPCHFAKYTHEMRSSTIEAQQ